MADLEVKAPPTEDPPAASRGTTATSTSTDDVPPPTEEPTGEEAEQNSWSRILAQVSTTAKAEDSTLLVLGDANSGKSAFLSGFSNRIHHKDSLKYVTDFSYVNVQDPDALDSNETIARMNIWQVNDPDQLLVLAETWRPAIVENLMVTITLDLSQPWTLLGSLTKWLETTEKFQKLMFDKLPASRQDKLKDNISRHIQFWVDPKADNPKVITEEQKRETKLDRSQPQKNLGVPLMVVGCKADLFKGLFAGPEVVDNFESLSFYLRQICFEYGAALTYTAAGSAGWNTEIAQTYLTHRLYDFAFSQSPETVGPETFDRIFVPTGFDQLEYIHQSSGAHAHKRNKFESTESAMATLFPVPKTQRDSNEVKAVTAKEDTTFLRTLKFDLETKGGARKPTHTQGFSCWTPPIICQRPRAHGRKRQRRQTPDGQAWTGEARWRAGITRGNARQLGCHGCAWAVAVWDKDQRGDGRWWRRKSQ
eukprot:GABV01000217.1.p1 GENE.GABV01000217.1~~GABV01000217.1.p1  ORF type:complete len:478 (-),score=120.15 GABV01000217.1:90-1523(-)